MAFLGMRGNGDWVADQRPKSYRESILYLYPNGMVPLTAILAKLKSESVDDPEFNWWTKTLPTQSAAITGVYTDVALSSAYTSGGVVGSVLYIKMAAASVAEFRIGHQVLLRDASDFTVDVNAKVIGKSTNGASSYIQVSLLEADDNSSYSHDLSDADRVIIIGNVNEEGAAMPSAIAYDPVKLYNYTQIFRTPLSITRTARKTKLRTGDQYKEAKREALELHSIEMERAFLFGQMLETTGADGKPERTTQGILNCLRANVPANVDDFMLNTAYDGKAWLDDGGGEDWLDAYLEVCFRYGSGDKLALCGSGALLGLNKLAKAGSHFTLTPTTKSYGINVVDWVTPFGTISLKTHPLFSMETSLQKSMLILEPSNLRYRYIDDTSFYGEGQAKQSGPGTNAGRRDGTVEEFLTEAGLEMHHPATMMFLNGVGGDNA
ncbi:MAG: DUF5309 family protein [Dehalococcoidia bacterium]|jgi:hypothetical protein